ncbi:MerR family transcriptional regulator [Thermorudis peleae]|uniref:MerR family transcriptional regulator n=1 Tax=Thermorudis peleae TaxID=1382356 RepID=UPI00068DAAF5
MKVLQPEFPELTMSSLRFLERIGLLAPERTPEDIGLYSLQDIERIRQIKRWQRARLSLAEIRERLERMRSTIPQSSQRSCLSYCCRHAQPKPNS